MSQSPFKTTQSSWTTGFSTVLAITLVLFMLGMLSVVLLNSQKLTRYFRENIQVQVYMRKGTNDAQVLTLRKELEAASFTKSAAYISAEDAAKIMSDEVGEDFADFWEFNPLPATLDLRIENDYAVPDSLSWIVQELSSKVNVREVVYHKHLIEKVDENVQKATLVLLLISIVLLIVAVALINNTIRLAIFSKRFIIKSMQLVGATKSFIVRPFIRQGIAYGLLAGALACALLVGFFYFTAQHFPAFFELQDITLLLQLFAIVFYLLFS